MNAVHLNHPLQGAYYDILKYLISHGADTHNNKIEDLYDTPFMSQEAFEKVIAEAKLLLSQEQAQDQVRSGAESDHQVVSLGDLGTQLQSASADGG